MNGDCARNLLQDAVNSLPHPGANMHGRNPIGYLFVSSFSTLVTSPLIAYIKNVRRQEATPQRSFAGRPLSKKTGAQCPF
uniref:Uncharacterized protein n=1 Tax=Anguilla anguilla TaxID=7936 RepID=A0A0E9UKJ8_ANGAN